MIDRHKPSPTMACDEIQKNFAVNLRQQGELGAAKAPPQKPNPVIDHQLEEALSRTKKAEGDLRKLHAALGSANIFITQLLRALIPGENHSVHLNHMLDELVHDGDEKMRLELYLGSVFALIQRIHSYLISAGIEIKGFTLQSFLPEGREPLEPEKTVEQAEAKRMVGAGRSSEGEPKGMPSLEDRHDWLVKRVTKLENDSALNIKELQSDLEELNGLLADLENRKEDRT